jgi:hypothetical protein
MLLCFEVVKASLSLMLAVLANLYPRHHRNQQEGHQVVAS